MEQAKEVFDSYAERVEEDKGSIVDPAACLAALRGAVAGWYHPSLVIPPRWGVRIGGAEITKYDLSE